MSDNDIELNQIFESIDRKLLDNSPEKITDEEINRVCAYYTKEKIRFDQDQSQFIKPGRKPTNNSAQAIIDRLKSTPLEF